MKMKKLILAITVLALLALMSIPAYADITGHTWLGTAYSGYDDYYNANVNAYRTGSTAVLTVTVQNNRPSGSNISVTKVYVTFDWGSTPYASTQVSVTNATLITNGASRTFYINFTVPDILVASNLFKHSYTIFADYNYKNPANTTQTISTRYQSNLFEDFVVYSSDQADAMNVAMIIDSFPTTSWQSAQARILSNKADNETATAMRYYEEGDFGSAKDRFNTALSYLNQAWDAEDSYLTMLQDLQIQRTQAEIGSLNAMTSFFNGLSTMWVLFGIGWVLLGIGYIIKWLRKRPEPPPATT
jgi:hypothetical protein